MDVHEPSILNLFNIYVLVGNLDISYVILVFVKNDYHQSKYIKTKKKSNGFTTDLQIIGEKKS